MTYQQRAEKSARWHTCFIMSCGSGRTTHKFACSTSKVELNYCMPCAVMLLGTYVTSGGKLGCTPTFKS